MKIYNSIDEFAASGVKKTIVTTGTFDGVHLGHQTILKRLNELSVKQDAESVLLTFSPHPRTVLFPDGEPMHFLSTFPEKQVLLKEAGIKHLIVHPFTLELAKVSAYNYVRDILVGKLHVKGLVIGHDHRFGRNREGSIKELKEWAPVLGFDVEELVPFKLGDITISSSKIRRAIAGGDLETANSYLGYTYSIHAKVVHGLNLGGKELGYPTANLEVEDQNKIIPGDGIYAVYATYEGKKYKGMMSIGFNPTVEGKGRSMEVHIFDFDSNIYDKHLSVFFYKKIRNEEKFDSMAALKKQLDNDKEVTLKLLA
ncbi:MAG TPA: bifunctional riboflavin kinase/FAD synthetase [Bacteroidia bacterium]|nr:bifunctional riboflavin kinase/FAD synthetase [Bacteroidia bacterium]